MSIVKNLKELKARRRELHATESEAKHQAQYVDLKKAQSKDEFEALVSGTEKKLDENLLDTMLPYADLMTLLLVFFVFFFIISSNEKSSFPELEETTAIEAEVQLNEKTIFLSSEILFEIAKADLKAGASNALTEVAEEIKKMTSIDKGWEIRIEGHTDNVPINNVHFKSNWELSTARAIAVVRYFLENELFDASELQAMGFGENRPIADNDTPENRKLNRRVEIKINKIYNEIRKQQ
jgi:flagellar motor protein MotB